MGKWTIKHSRHYIRYASRQGRGAQRLEELSLKGQSITTLRERRVEKRKQPTFHTPRTVMIYVPPEKHVHCFEDNLEETA